LPRQARRESQTGMYHIMMRGNNRGWIFKDKRYKTLYFNKLKECITESEIELYAWCIMDNHIHLVIHGCKEDIITMTKRVNSYFAGKYNHKERQVGHVFQDRYKSEAIEDEGYLMKVIRYVHQNPVKAKMVKKCSDYYWSSYNEYINRAEMYTCKSINIVEALFNKQIDLFVAYHDIEDEDEYLEIKEDIDKYREEKAQKIIEKYCRKYQLTNIIDIHRHSDIRDQIIKELISKSRLSFRRIAAITGMSYSSIQVLSKKLER
jgi:REP element-mobilizing transposase RayT